MNYLLDTCVISEVIKPKPNPAVIEWLQQQDENMLYLSILTFAEIAKGIVKTTSQAKQRRLTQWLETELKPRFEHRVIPVEYAVASQWAAIQGAAERIGRPMPTIDGLIAASAMAHHCTLVTRNVADVRQSGVLCLNPWEQQI